MYIAEFHKHRNSTVYIYCRVPQTSKEYCMYIAVIVHILPLTVGIYAVPEALCVKANSSSGVPRNFV
jgi:hypothetical protein